MLNNDDFSADELLDALRKGGFRKNLKQVQNADKKQRRLAAEERDSKEDKKGSKPMFLRPADLKGNYDFDKALRTSLGMPLDANGKQLTRKIEPKDLVAFKEYIDSIGKLYEGGITVEQVISLSHIDDITRANQQIHVARPVAREAGLVHFITNSSKGSKVPYHHVNVEFQAFTKLVLNTSLIKTTTVQNQLAKGKVKFECDCGRFKYWYRYINSIGGTVLGRIENGFPKETNPQLIGIACKHILRVMHFIKSAHGVQYLKRALDEDTTKETMRVRHSKNEVVREAVTQIVRANTKRNQIVPNLQKELKKLEDRANAKAKALVENKSERALKNKAMDELKALHKAGLVTTETFNTLMAQVK